MIGFGEAGSTRACRRYATLFYVELLAVADDASSNRPLALASDGAQSVTVGYGAVAMERGPSINTDGTTARITNWPR